MWHFWPITVTEIIIIIIISCFLSLKYKGFSWLNKERLFRTENSIDLESVYFPERWSEFLFERIISKEVYFLFAYRIFYILERGLSSKQVCGVNFYCVSFLQNINMLNHFVFLTAKAIELTSFGRAEKKRYRNELFHLKF